MRVHEFLRDKLLCEIYQNDNLYLNSWIIISLFVNKSKEGYENKSALFILLVFRSKKCTIVNYK